MTANTAGESFQKLVDVIAKLRAPNGCPWDLEQTPLSAAQYIIEEAFESVEAIESGDSKSVCEELGDLLMQPVFQAQMVADTSAQFTIVDVIDTITQKLIIRHPHVFGDTQVSNSTEVLANWEKMKATEKPDRDSMLNGLPKGLPSLLKAYRIGEKVARVGFDWKTTDGVLNKIEEEAKELHHAESAEALENEMGDLLFTLANLARHLKIDPEMALRKSSEKFIKRFQWIEMTCKQTSTPLQSLTDTEWDSLWDQAKLELTKKQQLR